MSHETDEQPDDIAEQLRNSGEVTLTFDASRGETLEGAAGLLTGLAELEEFEVEPSEVEITLRR